MATQTAIGSGSFKNNGGTVHHAGNASTTAGNPVTNVTTLRDNAIDDGYGSKVILSSPATAGSSGNLGTSNPNTSNRFAFQMVEGSYVMKKVTTTIAGGSNTTLRTGASDFGHHKNPMFLETSRTLGSGVTQSWNAVTGAITKGGNAGGLNSYNADHAARPTNAIPGELVYMVTGALPTQTDYAAKTNP